MNIKPITQQATRLLAVSTLSLSFTSQAALLARDLDGDLSTAEAYYSTDQDITWLADANYAQTSGYDGNGKMTWTVANAWAATLNFDGVTGWRLPNTVDVGNDGATFTNYYEGVDYSYNITTHSEMSYMFYEILGNTAWLDTSGMTTNCSLSPNYCLTSVGPFSNLSSLSYWSGTEYAPEPYNAAWSFSFKTGAQGIHSFANSASEYAWAVHSGDVGASVVPVPAAVWLFGSALLGLVGLKRKSTT